MEDGNEKQPGVKMDPAHEPAFGSPAGLAGKGADPNYRASQPKITDEQIEHWFKYHPSADKQEAFDAINAASVALCKVIRDHAPACADTSAAIRHVRDARMSANAAIACGGR